MAQRVTGGFVLPVAVIDPAAIAGRDARDRDIDLWNYLSVRPTIPINVPTSTVSYQLLGKQCILAGWSLRETTGTADCQVEFIDGANSADPVVGEQGINAPLPGSVGDVFVDVDASSATAASANNVTLPGVAGATTYITGFEITGNGATAASEITVTVTGILGGTKTYQLAVPLVAAPSTVQLIVEYARPIPASALNTAIVVNVPSFGVGNTFAAVTAHGYQLTLGSTANQSGQTATSDLGEPGVLCRSGLFLNILTGSVRGSVWVRV